MKIETLSTADVADSYLVTKITQGVKDPNRANIFINGKFDFSLGIPQLVDAKLKIGQKLTKSELAELRQLSIEGKLYQRTLEWVLVRPRSVKETKEYLWRKQKSGNPERAISGDCRRGTTKEIFAENFLGEETDGTRNTSKTSQIFADKIIDQLLAKNYLNDENFVKYYIENRFAKKGISKKRLVLELRTKGINSDLIAQVLQGVPRDDQSEIQKIIVKKRKKYDDQQLINYLTRQGFSYDLAQTAVLETDSRN